ncbi:MAG: PQQ-dependent sugar dehydrogenase [Pirellulaceae bacterium]|nr:PQQ-dependent sugar dehydrogenase [Planctomycetales bacterium]
MMQYTSKLALLRAVFLGRSVHGCVSARHCLVLSLCYFTCLISARGDAIAADLTLHIQDFATLPMTGSVNGSSNAAALARVNFLREEPGGAERLFVNDLNGPLYILDKQSKQFTTYLNLNGRDSNPGLFDKFTYAGGYANGFITFQFDPDYQNNGKFFTVHMEEPNVSGSTLPNNGQFSGFDTVGYTSTTAVDTPGSADRHTVLIEWTDANINNATFEGTAREILRLEENTRIHPLGDLIFNPTAQPGDNDWRVMYLASGDGGAGEQSGSNRLNPQRLDTLVGKILRIVPDLNEHTATSQLSSNGRYRIPNDNPFVDVPGAKDEVWANGLRNPHRMTWDVDPSDPANNNLIVSDIGLHTWEEINIIHAGANYGYSQREGTERLNANNTTSPLPANDTIPIQINATATAGTITPTYPVVQYPHLTGGGDAVSSGFVYRGTKIPALRGKFIFGDITTGHVWYADYDDMLSVDDGDPSTLAMMHEVDIVWDNPHDSPDDGHEVYSSMFPIVEDAYHFRGGRDPGLPGGATVSGTGRVDLRLAMDGDGELYLLSKSDGMIRAIMGPEANADFDSDGTVDGLDFLVWQQGFGAMGDLDRGDADGDGLVTTDDLAIWSAQLHGESVTARIVPEPFGGDVLFLPGMIGIMRHLMRRRGLQSR